MTDFTTPLQHRSQTVNPIPLHLQNKVYLQEHSFTLPTDHFTKIDWIDTSTRPGRLFTERYGLHPVEDESQTTSKYFTMPSEIHAELRKASTELHDMFAKATEYVLNHPEYWPYFGFPNEFWEHAKKSYQSGAKNLCGRFDFAVSPEYGIKCYEYNTDSASCLIECAYSQEAWCIAMGINNIGVDAGLGASKRVTAAWKSLFSPETLVHFFFDSNDGEEAIHTAYVSSLANQAGIRSKEISSVEGFRFDENGNILDADGIQVTQIWKSWNYTTLLEILEKEGPLHTREGETVRLIDICFNDNIFVLEPVWSAIPSNKAILPILTQLYPTSPYLLYSTFTLNDNLIANGYCSKPVLGRGGQNITLHYPSAPSSPTPTTENPESNSVDTTDGDSNRERSYTVTAPGKFASSPTVYQELATLPKFNNLYLQINTFAAAGKYAGTVIRVEESAIVGYDSNVFCLRVVEDESGVPLPNDLVEF